ncbi:competence protein ComEC [Flavobacterium endophyticum]|uniref:Competence protein ComEC n=1 Tax=Flavobacterium endophyticum TaxID=1540163 RepID=A0A495MRA1_9FLAO|nr:ComEC/Rec2 family competence protein [Flavobacterium endophyticum]RKS26779.1 competence protein ComEC [Flavobacterium endophyticum]
MKILKFPLARIAIWFILGVLAAFYTEPSPKFSLLFCSTSLIIFGIAYYFSKKDFLQKIYFGIAAYLVFFSIGVSTQAIHNERFFKNHYSHKIDQDDHHVEVALHEKLRSNASNERYIAKVCSIDTSNAKGKILLSISKEGLKQDFTIGSRLYVYGTISEPRAPSNPNQFDYRKYLANKSIYGQLYANVSEIKVSQKIDKNIWYYASEFRNTIIKNLKSSGFKNEELNVVIALILGQQQDISPELLKDYQLAGAVHILSVSGLHVGCIMIFIGFLLGGLPKTRWGNFIKIAILLSFLWAFAIIAGFSPSVTRSVVMFSFVAVGKYARRKTNIFHTLIVSMLFILLFEPSFIFDIGFQLSYCALFFIVWMQPLFSSVWLPKTWILKYFWDILTVSFAAQIGTFPLSTYYFHQFPGLFFITNLLVLPLLGFILALGVFVLVWAFFDIVPTFLAKSLEWSISLLNKIINWVASFESFIFQDISFSWQMLVACYVLILAFVLWVKQPNFQRLSFALSSLILLQLAYFGNKYFNQSQEELIVFNSKRNTILVERNGENIVVYTNNNLSEANLNFIIRPYLVGNFSHISKTERIQNLAYFNKNRILIVDSLGVFPKGLHPDIVIMTQSPKINLERVLQESRPKMIVADASNYRTDTQRWKATCEKEKIPFHSTVEKGFYSLSK